MKNLIDLHLHLDGSLSSNTVCALAEMQGVTLPKSQEELQNLLCAPKRCRDLNEYLERFELPLSLLQTAQAIELATFRLCQTLKQQELSYAEIRFAPQLHRKNGLSMREITAAAIQGMEKSCFNAQIILCCMRSSSNHAANIETLNTAKEFFRRGVCAIDLAGAEGLFKTESFDDIFALANSLSIPFTIHAGEADGADSVRTAILAGAKRIGHGVRAAESDAVMALILERGVTLEMCPTSNFQTGACKNIADYPLKKFLDMGIKVTINTDNMSVSNTTIAKEYAFAKEILGLSGTDLNKVYEYAQAAKF